MMSALSCLVFACLAALYCPASAKQVPVSGTLENQTLKLCVEKKNECEKSGAPSACLIANGPMCGGSRPSGRGDLPGAPPSRDSNTPEIDCKTALPLCAGDSDVEEDCAEVFKACAADMAEIYTAPVVAKPTSIDDLTRELTLKVATRENDIGGGVVLPPVYTEQDIAGIKEYLKSCTVEEMKLYGIPDPGNIKWGFTVGGNLISLEEAKVIAENCLALPQPVGRKKRQVPTDPERLWPNSVVNYIFCANVETKVKQLVRNAVKILQNNTCLTFKEEKSDNMIVVSTLDNVCSAYHKKDGYQQLLIGHPNCHNIGTAVHLLLTALGMYNAPQRPDRDAYISVNMNNVKPESLVSFRKCTDCETFGIPPDMAGSMMTSSKSWTKNNKRTSEPLDLRQLATMGSHYTGPTFYDFLMIKMAYCPDKCENRPNRCEEGGFRNTNNCLSCTCPDGYTAKWCQKVERGSPVANCGGELTATPEWQTINSPRYPFKHKAGQRCSWIIKAPEPGQQIEFEFIGDYFGFYYSSAPLCINYVDVRLKEDQKQTGIMHCGYDVPKDKYLSDTNKMSVLMRADGDPEFRYFGFKARYRISEVLYDEEPKDCVMSEWEEWNACSESCGGGLQIRQRSISEPPKNGGADCTQYMFDDIQECNNDPCPIDCEVGDWGDWGACSTTCGGGSHERIREVLVEEQNGGAPCPNLLESKPCNSNACPVDCEVGEWREWNTCSATCGLGSQDRTRNVLLNDNNGGKPCSDYAFKEQQECGADPCPVDCGVSQWTPYDVCTVTCGGGDKTRTRKITQPAENGGAACPEDLSDTVDCGTTPCPVDCKLSEWDDWGECTHSCGGGTQQRSRTVEQEAANGGQSCDTFTFSDTRPCGVEPCPIPCEVSEWSEWDTCSVSCGEGQQRKIRDILVDAADGGDSCENYALEEKKSCNPGPCPVDCLVNGWSEWLECSVSCGGGSRSRNREVSRPDANGGEACPILDEEESCNANPCPIDCIVGEWAPFGECSELCGGGEQQRFRPILTFDDYGGKPCSDYQIDEIKPCNQQPCPIDCITESWSDWATCPVTCGGGLTNRARAITRNSQYGGKACPENLYEEAACSETPCPIDCVMNDWVDWGDCTSSCGGGEQERTRSVQVEGQFGGLSCNVFPKWEDRGCGDRPCPIPCEVSEWSDWGTCSATCGGGEQERTRQIDQQSEFGGESCENYSLLETQTCNDNSCPVDCMVGPWSSYSECTVSCGGGNQKKSRAILRAEAYGGIPCSQYSLEEEQECSPDPCPIDCVLEEWKPWSECSVTCGGSTESRARNILVRDDYGGKSCNDYAQEQSRDCNTSPCPIDCEVSPWAEWDSCSVSCDGGQKQRQRTVTVEGAFGGLSCSEFPLSETAVCGETPCPIDCVVSNWNPWDFCSHTCGGGDQQRIRTITTETANGGTKCPALIEHQPCGDRECPIPCEVSDWSAWETCSATCGGGIQKRNREITQEAQFEGDSCSAYSLEEEQSCGNDPCPIDCLVSDWSPWEECSITCGGGKQGRNREIQRQDQFGGETCPDELSSAQECNSNPCPINCQLGNWTIWSECSTTCGGGLQERSRPVAIEAAFGGLPCPDETEEEQTCSQNPCPVDCEVTEWSEWSICDVICDGGIQQRTRNISSQAFFGGKPCSEFPLKNEQACNDEPCPQCDTTSCPDNEHCIFKNGKGATCACNEGFSRRYGVCIEILCGC